MNTTQPQRTIRRKTVVNSAAELIVKTSELGYEIADTAILTVGIIKKGVILVDINMDMMIEQTRHEQAQQTADLAQERFESELMYKLRNAELSKATVDVQF